MKISTFFVLYLIITNFTFSFTQDKEYSVFQHMYEYVKGLNKMKRIAVAGADNLDSLKAFRKLKDLGIADFILVGPVERIDKLAHENNIDISDFEIVDKKRCRNSHTRSRFSKNESCRYLLQRWIKSYNSIKSNFRR